MSCNGVTARQLPSGGIEESNASRRKLSSTSYLPECNDEYGPDPRLSILPKRLTVFTQLELLRFLPTRAAMSWNMVSTWHASLMEPFVPSVLPPGPCRTSWELGACFPVYFS